MPPLDIDPQILSITAAASAHAYAQSIWHIEEEIKAASGVMEPLYDSLTPEGPYAYMVIPEVRADGSVKLPRLTLREEIVDAYNMIRGHSDLTEVIGLTEVRGTWYTFQDNVSRVRIKTDPDPVYSTQTLGLFPSGGGAGITGELIWIPRSRRDPRWSRRGEHDPNRPTARSRKGLRALRAVPERHPRQRHRRCHGRSPR